MMLKNYTRSLAVCVAVIAIFFHFVESHSASGSFSVRLNTNKPCTCNQCNRIKTTNELQRPIYVKAESVTNEPSEIGRKKLYSIQESSIEECGRTAQDFSTSGFQKTIFPSFKPIGDLCDDSDTLKTSTVLPAHPGTQKFTIRHTCDGENPTYYQTGTLSHSSQSLNHGSSSYNTYGGYRDLAGQGSYYAINSNGNYNDFDLTRQGELSYAELENFPSGNGMSSTPADPVSVTLAYKNLLAPYVAQLTRRNNIQEGRLSFGPRGIPIDGRVHQTLTTTVPEEKLIIVDKPIVELKTSTSTCGCSNKEADIIEEEPELEVQRFEQQHNIGSSGVPTYSDLGYEPIESSGNRFITMKSSSDSYGARAITSVSSSYDDDEPPCGRLGAPLADYRPGVVIEHGKGCGCKDSSKDISGSHKFRKSFGVNPRRQYMVQRRS